MQLAYSKRRASHISADEAGAEDAPFLCMNPDCRRPVTLHRTSPHYHFQHARGKGSPKCFLFGGRLELVARTIAPARRGELSRPPRSTGPTLLFSGDTSTDFSLEIRLPDVDATRPWSGTVVVHERGERRVQFERLRYGVSHLRPQSAYEIKCNGDIDPEYRALIDGLTVGLNQIFNVFPYGLRGTELLESDRPLRCDKTYWIITQQAIAQPTDCAVAAFSTQTWLGWWVSRLDLPSYVSLSSDQVSALESWLQRPLMPESTRVIIRTPTPHHFLDNGIAVFPLETESLVLEAKEQRDLRLEFDGVAKDSLGPLDELGLYSCLLGGSGRWTVFCDSRALLTWEVRDCPVFSPPSIALVSKDSQIDLFHPDAARFVSTAANRREQIHLRVGDPRLFAVVKINGHSLQSESDVNLCPIDPQVIRSIRAANFGYLEIATASPGAILSDSELLKPLEGRIRWLHGVATSSNDRELIAMSGRPSTEAPRWITALVRARWSSAFAPQVRSMTRDLVRAGAWHVC